MDYRYIEQLLERYWIAETTLEEERILRAFFAQKELPNELLPLQPLFQATHEHTQARLSDDFEARLLAQVEATSSPSPRIVKALRPSLFERLRPMYNAAAAIALFLLVGGAVQHAFQTTPTHRYAIGNTENSQDILATSDSIREDLKTLRRVGKELPTATTIDTTLRKDHTPSLLAPNP